MTHRRLFQAIVRLYPQAWRDRYGQECMSTITDLLDAAQARPLRLAVNLLRVALKERVRPTVVGPISTVGFFVPPPSLLRHKDWRSRRRLNQRELTLFGAREEIIGTFDGYTISPYWRGVGRRGIFISAIWSPPQIYLALNYPLFPAGEHRWFAMFGLVWGPAIGVAGLLLVIAAYLRGWPRIMLAATTAGLVTLRLDRLGRPTAVIARRPALKPVLLRQGRLHRRVRLGDLEVWIPADADPVLSHMTNLGVVD